MRDRRHRASRFAVACFGVALLVLAGGLLASNMGFKIHYQLYGPPSAQQESLNWVALPYTPKPGMTTVRDLFEEIPDALRIDRHVTSNDTFQVYSFGGGVLPPNGWDLIPGEALIVRVASDQQIKLVGSHDPSVVVHLYGRDGPSSSLGENYIAPPYHTTAQTARELFAEIGGSIIQIERLRPDHTFDLYNLGGGTLPPDGWNLVPGEGYKVKLAEDEVWFPTHY